MDVQPSQESVSTMRIASFNCHGLKSSIGYVTQLASNHHVKYVCEHWLLPKDIPTVWETFQDMGKTAFLNSSVDPLVPLHGRPYGGTGFICDISDGFSFKFEECESGRLCGLLVYKNEKLVLTVYGVYLSCDDRMADTMECYMETLDRLQSLLDSSDSSVPAIITGDMNTCLPQSKLLRNEWYRQRPFSRRSALLYEFLSENELCVSNYAFHQSVDYT